MRMRIIPTKSLGCCAVPLTPASPTMPMAKPAARPARPTERPAPSCTKPLASDIDTATVMDFMKQHRWHEIANYFQYRARDVEETEILDQLIGEMMD